MHLAACAGNADKFFSNVDEDTFARNIGKRIVTDGTVTPEVLVKTDTFALWRKDILLAKDGNICAWTYTKSEPTSGGQQVEAQSARSGKRITLSFTDSGGHLKATDYVAEGQSFTVGTEPVDMTVNVSELLSDYKGNELRGDNKYKGKRVRIIGKAGAFKRDLTNTIFMTVGTGAQFEIPEAQCFFGDQYADRVASLTKGALVMVNCTVDGLMMNVLMKDCTFPDVTTLNACYELQNAGIATMCQPLSATSEGTGYCIRNLPPTLDESKIPDFMQKNCGAITLLKDDDSYAAFTAKIDTAPADAGLPHAYVGAPSSRMVVTLPPTAAPDLAPRIKAVASHFTPASL